MNPRYIPRKAISFIYPAFCLCLAVSCTKPVTEPKPEEKIFNYLVGMGNRYWRLKEMYINNRRETLTPDQLKYYKTYTVRLSADIDYSGTFADYNGFIGTWELKGTDHILENITNVPSGIIKLDLKINSISANDLDVTYVANRDTVRTIYFGY
jgi:hypothetical protein